MDRNIFHISYETRIKSAEGLKPGTRSLTHHEIIEALSIGPGGEGPVAAPKQIAPKEKTVVPSVNCVYYLDFRNCS